MPISDPVSKGPGRKPDQRRFYVNGRFLEQPFSGVQRYAREIVLALDRILSREQEHGHSEQWTVLTTGRAETSLDLQHIQVRRVPSSLKGHAWEQAALAYAARDGALIGLGGSGPVLHREQLIVIHDASVFRHSEFFSRPYALFHRRLDRLLARRGRIATVSNFSRQELADVLHLTPASIPIFRNGGDHMRRLEPTFATVDRLKLRGRRYFVLLGNRSKNKNIEVALRALKHVPDALLVFVGGLDTKVFGRTRFDAGTERVVLAGRLDDASIAGLLLQAQGLLFPSLYEGFGIPPLEALVNGCPVAASDIPAVREVCGDAALYFDPQSAEDLAARMQQLITEPLALRHRRQERGRERGAQFAWQHSARELLNFCRNELAQERSIK